MKTWVGTTNWICCSGYKTPSIFKSTREVICVKGTWHSHNTLPTMFHGQTFRIITWGLNPLSATRGRAEQLWVWALGSFPPPGDALSSSGFEHWEPSRHPRTRWAALGLSTGNLPATRGRAEQLWVWALGTFPSPGDALSSSGFEHWELSRHPGTRWAALGTFTSTQS